MRALIGVDEGTSAVKAAMFDLSLRPIASARCEKSTSHPAEGIVEQDAEAVLEAVVHAVAELLHAVPEAEIVGCGLDHQGESVLAWDRESGRPLSPIVTWQDKRSQQQIEGFDHTTLGRITERSGLPVDPYFSAGKVAWLLQQDLPDDVCVGTVDSFLCARLGAGFATDLSTASRTQLAGLGEREWDDELCSIFGVRPSCLPALRESVGELGTLRHDRWSSDLPLCAQIVDQQAALAGAGCVIPGRVKATFGTGVFVLAFTGAAAPAGAAASGVVPTVAWAADGEVHYALDGGVFSAGALLDWLADGLGAFESPLELAQLAGSVADTHGVRVLPALAGLGAPWWKPDARGVIAGLSGATEPAHIARAAIEGICHRVCDVLDAMAGFVGIEDLRVDGGLTQAAIVPKLLADLSRRPVHLAGVDATALGAAALAGVGAGVISSIENIAELVPPERVYPPAPVVDERAAWRVFVTRAGALSDDRLL